MERDTASADDRDTDPGDQPVEVPIGRRDRFRQVVPFLAAVVAALGLACLPPLTPNRFPLLALATAGFALCATLIVILRWEGPSMWPRLGVVVVFCTSVAVVREATGGSASGFAGLLFLVVVWQAAYGRRWELLATLALVASTLVVPVLVLGLPHYPTTEWRRAAMLALTSAIIGGVVQQLVRQIRRERGLLATIGRLARSTASGEDPRRHICEAAREITGADMVILFEPLGEDLRVTQTAGVELPRVVLPAELVTPNLRTAIDTQEPSVVLDAFADPESYRPAQSLGMRGWAHQPAARHGTTTVLLTVAWREPLRRGLPHRVRAALPLLAAEAAAVIDRADLVDQLAALARQDPLTGLMNRRAWDDHLAREVARTGRTGRPLTVAVLDLDHFKAFNDEHGHLVGDQLLKAAAGSWAAALRTSDVLARWGGEEFAVLMPDTAADEARNVLGRLARCTPMEQTFSAGFVTTAEEVDPDRVMAGADTAVYAAKDAGRDRCVEGSIAPAPTGIPPAPAEADAHAPSGGTRV